MYLCRFVGVPFSVLFLGRFLYNSVNLKVIEKSISELNTNIMSSSSSSEFQTIEPVLPLEENDYDRTIQVRRCSDKEDPRSRCHKIVINGPGNAITFIILLMLDQLHDFGEEVRGKNVGKIEKATHAELDLIRIRTKEFIENFQYQRKDDEPPFMTDFTTFIQSNPEFQKVYSDIMDSEIKKLLSGENKYNLANRLINAIGIQKVTFDNLEQLFDPDETNYYPNYSCNDIKNVFYHYLIYSGYIKNGSMTKKLKITVDAHGSRYNISPILYNICDFIFSSEYSFSQVQMSRSIATEYDAAGTQGAESYVNTLEDRKKERIKKMKDILSGLEHEFYNLPKLASQLDDDPQARKRSRTEYVPNEERIAELNYQIDKLHSDILKLEQKDISTRQVHDLIKSGEFKKTYVVTYGHKTILKYSLMAEKDADELDYNCDGNVIFSNLNNISNLKRDKIIFNALVDIYVSKGIGSRSQAEELTLSSIQSVINKKMKFNASSGFKFVLSYLKLSSLIPDKKDTKKVTDSKKKNKPELIRSLELIRSMGVTSSEIFKVLIVPKISTWLDYDKKELLAAKNNLVFDNSGNYYADFAKNGMSQGHIVRVINEKKLTDHEKLYYYPFKTIGDLSQIQECAHDSMSTESSTIHIFLTFDRICGYISSLFNRTILEESDKTNSALFNLKTFIYNREIVNMSFQTFRDNYEQILRGRYRDFGEIQDYDPEESMSKRRREKARKSMEVDNAVGNAVLMLLDDSGIEDLDFDRAALEYESAIKGNL